MKAAILILFIMNESKFCPIEISARKFRANTINLHLSLPNAERPGNYFLYLNFQREHTCIYFQLDLFIINVFINLSVL
jgi:hypothetical protein